MSVNGSEAADEDSLKERERTIGLSDTRIANEDDLQAPASAKALTTSATPRRV